MHLKCFCFGLALLLWLPGNACAAPVLYDIKFVITQGTGPMPTGSLSFDPSTREHSISISYGSTIFGYLEVPYVFVPPPPATATYVSCTGITNRLGQVIFDILSGACGQPKWIVAAETGLDPESQISIYVQGPPVISVRARRLGQRLPFGSGTVNITRH